MLNVSVTGFVPAQQLWDLRRGWEEYGICNVTAAALGVGWNQLEPGQVQQWRLGRPGLAAGPQNPQAQAIIEGSANKSFPPIPSLRSVLPLYTAGQDLSVLAQCGLSCTASGLGPFLNGDFDSGYIILEILKCLAHCLEHSKHLVQVGAITCSTKVKCMKETGPIGRKK